APIGGSDVDKIEVGIIRWAIPLRPALRSWAEPRPRFGREGGVDVAARRRRRGVKNLVGAECCVRRAGGRAIDSVEKAALARNSEQLLSVSRGDHCRRGRDV